MNISEFEQHLREGNTPQHFPPQEEKWMMLEEELHKKRRGAIFVLPKRTYWLAAASVALLLSLGLYTIYNRPSDSGPAIVQKPAIVQPGNSGQALTQDTASEMAATVVAGQAKPQNGQTARPEEQKKSNPYIDIRPEDKVPGDSTVIVKVEKQEPQQKPVPQQADLPKRNEPLPFDNEKQYANANPGRLGFGVSALYGFSAVSKAQYRVAVYARKDISRKVFANVQVVASTAKLSTSTTYEYQALSLGGQGAVPQTSTQSTEAIYSGNVYTLGLSPSIGFRLTKKLSLSAGPDIQKVLSNSILLSNKEEFRNQINNQTLIEDKHSIANLDMGIQSTAQMNVSDRLALSLLYRYGITDYLKKRTQTTRNSFMSIGLSYSFH